MYSTRIICGARVLIAHESETLTMTVAVGVPMIVLVVPVVSKPCAVVAKLYVMAYELAIGCEAVAWACLPVEMRASWQQCKCIRACYSHSTNNSHCSS